jgi:hypothetical protein
MARSIKAGDCVRLPDGRIGRVRGKLGGEYKIRVRCKASATHQFLIFGVRELELIDCPQGWMSPEGYNRYLKKTLTKMRSRK